MTQAHENRCDMLQKELREAQVHLKYENRQLTFLGTTSKYTVEDSGAKAEAARALAQNPRGDHRARGPAKVGNGDSN